MKSKVSGRSSHRNEHMLNPLPAKKRAESYHNRRDKKGSLDVENERNRDEDYEVEYIQSRNMKH